MRANRARGYAVARACEVCPQEPCVRARARVVCARGCVRATLSHTCGQGWLKPFRSDQISARGVLARARFARKGHVCVRARVWCARVGVCAQRYLTRVGRGGSNRSDQIRSARVVCSRVRGLPARAMCACARACGVRAWVCARVCARVACVCARARVRVVCLCRPEGNGAMTQRWPFICAPRSDSRPWCPPGCSCGPQTPSYATKLAELTQKSRFPKPTKKKLKGHDDRRQTAHPPPEVSRSTGRNPLGLPPSFFKKKRGVA